jgi:RNA polymerase sigma-70 factor, ECF subfamily
MANDRDRFERIYRENLRAVLRFAVARIDPERAKDVVAEIFLVAWRRLDDVPAEPRAWLLGVARRVIAGQYRMETRREALALRLRGEPDAAADPRTLRISYCCREA